jgi:molecular chaperone HscB
MIEPDRNHFELFGLPATFRIDAAALDRAYRALQTEVHPDRFADAGDAERRLAMQRSSRVNEAYRALKDPVERARYLLSLRGIEAFDERDTQLALPFLEAQLERRERAAEAAERGEIAVLDAILREVRAESAERQRSLETMLADAEGGDAAKALVRELRFLAKVAEDVEAMLSSLDA